MENSLHVRSFSMPTSAHPTALGAEQVIQRLFLLVSSSSMTTEMMCDGLKALEHLYVSLDDLLHLPGTEQNLCSSTNRRRLEQEVDASIRILDICARTKDMMLTIREHVQDLQSEMRRKGDHLPADLKLRSCMRVRKEIKKMISVWIKESTEASSKSNILDTPCKASQAMKILTEARKIMISLLSSLLESMSLPTTKASRWSFVLKVMQKRRVSCEDVSGDQLETMHQNLEILESGLKCLYKPLIQNRVSLLNLLSF